MYINKDRTPGMLNNSAVLIYDDMYDTIITFIFNFFLKPSGKLSKTKSSISNPIRQCYWARDEIINTWKEQVFLTATLAYTYSNIHMGGKCAFDEQLGVRQIQTNVRKRNDWHRRSGPITKQGIMKGKDFWNSHLTFYLTDHQKRRRKKKKQTQNSSL